MDHKKQTIVILGVILGILFSGVTVIDQLDAFGLKQVSNNMMDHENRIIELEKNERVVEEQLDHINKEIIFIRQDISWIKSYLISNGNP